MRRALAVALALPFVLVGTAASPGDPHLGPEVPAGTPSTQPLTVVSLTFDDGYSSQVPAARVLAEAGLGATFFVNSGLLGTRPYAETTWVSELVDLGHEVGGHTTGHLDLVELGPARRRAVVCQDRRALQLAGAPVTSFAYPYGSYDPGVVAAVQACGYSSARAASGLRSGDGSCSDCPTTESLAPLDHRFNVRTPSTVRADDTVEDLARLVEDAERTGGWLPLVFHRVCDGCAEESVSLEVLEELARWLGDRPPSTVVLEVGEVTAGDGGLAADAVAAAAVGAAAPATRDSEAGSGEDADASASAWLPGPREEASIRVLGVPVDQLLLLGGGILLATLLLVVHRLATRRGRHR